MLNDHLQSPVTQQRLRAGLTADHIDGFADWLHDQGYKPTSITTILRSLAAWSDWATQAGTAISEAIEALDSCKALVARADRPRYSRGPNNHSLSAAALFIRFLQEHGVLACSHPVPPPTEVWPILSDFRAWMQQQGGLRESSLDTYQFVIVEMLEVLGDRVHTYTAAQVRDFVEQCAKPHGLWRAKSITTATRAFLRFLSATGHCAAGLEHAIPSYASWALSSVPRFLEPADVERVLAVCGAEDTIGLRDRAVMLLLARLGLRAYARFATERGDTHVRATTAVEWAEAAPSPDARHIRLRDVVNLARFLHAEDIAHEVPVLAIFPARSVRPMPYIYTADEIARMMTAAGKLRETHPLRRPGYATLLGLIASTGLRVSEALDLRFDDVLADGVLHIRRSKFGKSRRIPLHATTKTAFDRYLKLRQAHIVPDDHVFLSTSNRRISSSMVNYTFRRILKLARIAPGRARTPRLHDLRHTMATRALEHCSVDRRAVSRHFVALSTYLGHLDIKQTYWYLQATPELMTDIAAAAEAFADGGEQ